jgi:hypothetical protein
MSAVVSILATLAPDLFKTIDKAVMDKDLANQLKADITTKLISSNEGLVKASSDVIIAEVSGESWLQRSWRPMLMLWFAFLIGAYWFGFTPVNMPEESVNALFTLVQIGVGGYVVGRSVEKTASTLAPSLGIRERG